MNTMHRFFIPLFVSLAFVLSCTQPETGTMQTVALSTQESAIGALVARHGESSRDRIEKGVRQAAAFWGKADGSAEEFKTFCMEHFIADPALLEKTLDRFEKNMESMNGHLLEIQLNLNEPLDLDIGPLLPVDGLFAGFVPKAHLNEDLFQSRIAFAALLNFPLVPLSGKIEQGLSWSRRQWAEALLADRFRARVSPEASRALAEAGTRADQYISGYNLYMHHLLDPGGERLFPPGMKLISHWNLRDELKSRYSDPGGLKKQEMISLVMEKIIRQEIPRCVIDNPAVDWTPSTGQVSPSPVQDVEGVKPVETADNAPEPDTRYATLLALFHGEEGLDPYYPTMPTLIDRAFQRDRQIPEETVKALFTTLMTSPVIEKTARLIEKRLGRPLLPFDIWYNGFQAESPYTEAELDRIVSARYPAPEAFRKDIPRILRHLGFDEEKARFISSKINVDPARGVGHAWGAEMREANAHLRTRVAPTGMNYKAYSIAVHELGHNVEQVLSLNMIDHTLLQGVPNTGFTEAFAFVFQDRHLELLGLRQSDPLEESLKALQNLWSVYEIAGVALVDMEVWHWMYAHRSATPGELKNAVIAIAQKIWNEYYAPAFGNRDAILLGIYSHMIFRSMYLPDYPLGHIIANQIESYLKGKSVGKEMERMCTLGAITPDAWMQQAVHGTLSVQPLIDSAEHALSVIR